jgi:hypothetical protein
MPFGEDPALKLIYQPIGLINYVLSFHKSYGSTSAA